MDELLQWVQGTKLPLVLLTGGEPLLQSDLPRLAVALAESERTVLVETSGAYDIGVLPAPIIRAMDIKCPGSGESERILWSNIEKLRPDDAVKMVLTSREDYDYAKAVIQRYKLGFPLNILLSSAYPDLESKQLAEWIVEDRLDQVRLNVQLHRILWPGLG
jgi:7-carboxy-7-deazaguanine synthase